MASSPYIQPLSSSTTDGSSRILQPAAVVVWSGGKMRQLVTVIDVAVKAGMAVLALLSLPSRAEPNISATKGLEERRHMSSIQRSIQLNASGPQSFISP